MNNVHRSDYVEAIVALACEDSGWKRMTPWDLWDFEHESKVKLEVKQSAAAQGWGAESKSSPRFDIAARQGGRHADVYVFAWHGERGETTDQREPDAWEFYVVRERELPDQKTIGLNAIQGLAASCGIENLALTVERARRCYLAPCLKGENDGR